MKVLIFSTETGQGHNYASQAIVECCKERGIEAYLLDILNSGKKEKSKTVSKIYNWFVNNAPSIFGFMYHIGEIVSSNKHHSPIYWLNTLYVDSLYEQIELHNPDAIICPHVFSAQAITRLIEKKGFNIPTVGLITDYTWSPFWEETKLDAYVVACKENIEDFTKKGMDREKLFPYGIPVRKKFRTKHKKKDARTVFGITKEKVFVVAGGSMGYGKIPEMSAGLLEKMPDSQVIALCGNNQETLEKTKNISGVIALPFIDNIDVLMDAADVLLSKPGGSFTTEAINKNIPFVITMPIPGGEVRNSDCLDKMGMTVSAHSVNEAVEVAYKLVTDSNARKEMIASQKSHCNVNAAEDMINLVIKIIKEKKNEQKEEYECLNAST